MSSEIPVRPRGSGIPAWLIALIAATVLIGLVLFLAGGVEGEGGDATRAADGLAAALRGW